MAYSPPASGQTDFGLSGGYIAPDKAATDFSLGVVPTCSISASTSSAVASVSLRIPYSIPASTEVDADYSGAYAIPAIDAVDAAFGYDQPSPPEPPVSAVTFDLSAAASSARL